jgi:hypothetical protein
MGSSGSCCVPVGTIDARLSTRTVTTAGATAFTIPAYEVPGTGAGDETEGDDAATRALGD